MILVIALPDLALRLSELLVNASYVVRVADATDLRHRVYSHQPEIVLLDWRIGGSGWRAIDEVTAMVSRTKTHPYVIALLPRTDRGVKAEAAKVGCYGVINVGALDADRVIVESVAVARRARSARGVDHRRVHRLYLH